MKKFFGLLLSFLLITACNSDKKKDSEETGQDQPKQEMAYESHGMEITANDALDVAAMSEKYAAMQIGDTVNAKMVATVDEVCQTKGCWMKLNMGDGQQVMVRFKDYGFFMPKDIAGKDVIINGMAFVDEMSVEDQRHYAEDAGESEEAIAAITEPKKTLSFEADGVLIKQ